MLSYYSAVALLPPEQSNCTKRIAHVLTITQFDTLLCLYQNVTVLYLDSVIGDIQTKCHGSNPAFSCHC